MCYWKAVLVVTVSFLLSACVTQTKLPDASVSLDKTQWSVTDQANAPIQIFPAEMPPELRAYISDTLSHNHNLKTIATTAQAAKIGVGVVSANVLPQANVSLNTQRGNNGLNNKAQTGVTLSGNVSWVIDIWGKLSDETKAAEIQAQAEQQNYIQARRVLLAQALDAWITYWEYVQNNKILQDIKSVNASQLSVLRDRYESGLSSYEEYIAQKKTNHDVDIRLKTADTDQQKIRHLMNVLRGRMPASELKIHDTDLVPVLLPIKENIAAKTIASRPDIQAAFKRVQVLDKETQASYKALLPQINLTGSLTKNAPTLTDAFGENLIWQLVGGVTQPIFNGGQLRKQVQQKSKEAQSAFYAYEDAVLKALQEVEDAMAQEHGMHAQLQITQRKMTDMKRRLQSAQEQYRDGSLPAYDYLSVCKEYLESKYEYQNLQSAYLKNRVTLVLSLAQPFGVLEGKEHEE